MSKPQPYSPYLIDSKFIMLNAHIKARRQFKLGGWKSYAVCFRAYLLTEWHNQKQAAISAATLAGHPELTCISEYSARELATDGRLA